MISPSHTKYISLISSITLALLIPLSSIAALPIAISGPLVKVAAAMCFGATTGAIGRTAKDCCDGNPSCWNTSKGALVGGLCGAVSAAGQPAASFIPAPELAKSAIDGALTSLGAAGAILCTSANKERHIGRPEMIELTVDGKHYRYQATGQTDVIIVNQPVAQQPLLQQPVVQQQPAAAAANPFNN